MSATRAFALRSALRTACRPARPQARTALSRRGYASVQGTAHQAAHKAGSDLPWLATSAVISIPTLGYLLMNGPEKKSHDDHKAEAADEHGVKPAKPESEVGEPKEPVPTAKTDTGDAESKGHEDSEDAPKDESDKKEDDSKEDDSKEDASGEGAKDTEKKSTDESEKDGLAAGKKGKGELDDDHKSQEEKLSDKPDSKRVDPTEK